jgi:8-oxo-dGTP pyrophosphatase MutT (NUDIX family)
VTAGRPGDQQVTPPGSPSLSELLRRAEATLDQRIVLEDSHFQDPDGPRVKEGNWSAGTLVRDEHGRVLWVKPDGWDGWTGPGGSVEPGETLRAAARRETREESGLTVSVGRPLVVVTQTYVPESNPDREDPGGFVLFDAPVDGSPALPDPDSLGVSDETVRDLDWFDQHPPLEAIHPIARDCLSAIGIVPGETALDGDVWS